VYQPTGHGSSRIGRGRVREGDLTGSAPGRPWGSTSSRLALRGRGSRGSPPSPRSRSAPWPGRWQGRGTGASASRAAVRRDQRHSFPVGPVASEFNPRRVGFWRPPGPAERPRRPSGPGRGIVSGPGTAQRAVRHRTGHRWPRSCGPLSAGLAPPWPPGPAAPGGGRSAGAGPDGAGQGGFRRRRRRGRPGLPPAAHPTAGAVGRPLARTPPPPPLRRRTRGRCARPPAGWGPPGTGAGRRSGRAGDQAVRRARSAQPARTSPPAARASQTGARPPVRGRATWASGMSPQET